MDCSQNAIPVCCRKLLQLNSDNLFIPLLRNLSARMLHMFSNILKNHLILKSSHSQVFYKRTILKNSQSSQEITFAGVFFQKRCSPVVCNLLKMNFRHGYFRLSFMKMVRKEFWQSTSEQLLLRKPQRYYKTMLIQMLIKIYMKDICIKLINKFILL